MGVYPGLGLPLRYWPRQGADPIFPMGSHSNFWGSDSLVLQVREVAVMMVVDILTDKENWHKKVYDGSIVAKWRQEAMAIPDEALFRNAASQGSSWFAEWAEESPEWDFKKVKRIMSDELFDYCIQELRSKAHYFEATGLIPTLDASATVVKSDVLVKDDLRQILVQAFQKLQADQADHPDWHPRSNDMVQDLAHPSMYPLIYGRSKVIRDEVVGVSDAVRKWAGKGDIIEKEATASATHHPDGRRLRADVGGSDLPESFWSDTYQWLPANVAFRKEGKVEFTSYINNLHPTKYPEIYSAIEKFIEKALPAWDQCLLTFEHHRHTGPGRKGVRFRIPEHAE